VSRKRTSKAGGGTRTAAQPGDMPTSAPDGLHIKNRLRRYEGLSAWLFGPTVSFMSGSLPAAGSAAQVIATTNPGNENWQDDEQNIHVEGLLFAATAYHVDYCFAWNFISSVSADVGASTV
jgi:hypothetical protein